MLCSFTSNGKILNILPMGLFHYNIWYFSKGFYIFVRECIKLSIMEYGPTGTASKAENSSTLNMYLQNCYKLNIYCQTITVSSKLL